MALLSKRTAPYAFALLLSCFMTFIVSGIATLLAVGTPHDFLWLWARSWITAWVIAFPALLFIRPLVHRVVDRYTG